MQHCKALVHITGVISLQLLSSASLSVGERGFRVITIMMKSTGKLLNEEIEKALAVNYEGRTYYDKNKKDI